MNAPQNPGVLVTEGSTMELCPICDQASPCACCAVEDERPTPTILPRRGLTRAKSDAPWATINYSQFYCKTVKKAESVRKRVTLDENGDLENLDIIGYPGGTAVRRRNTLDDFGREIQRATPPSPLHAFYVSGVSPECEINKSLLMGDERRRTKDGHPFPEQDALLTVDSDSLASWPTLETIEDVVDVLAQLGLDAGCVAATSGSSGLKWPKGERGLRGLHTFYSIDKGAEIPRVLETLHVRAWLAGYGRILVCKNGVLSPRSIVDPTLKTPNQPIFEFGAILLDKRITQKREVRGFRSLSGVRQVKADSIAPLTDEEQAEYARRVDEAKAELKPEAEQATAAWLDRVTTKVPEADRAAERERRLAQREKQHRDLTHPQDIVYLNDMSEVTVTEILADREKWHGKGIRDPDEPEYGTSKATIVTKNQRDGRAKILSRAHGIDVTYYLEPRPMRVSPEGFDPELFGGDDALALASLAGALVWVAKDGKKTHVAPSVACDVLVPVLRGRVAWARKAMSWHVWDGACWAPQETGADAGKILHDLVDLGCGDKGFGAAYIRSIEDVLKMGDRLPIPDWDDAKFIPFRNGVLDAGSREFRPTSNENGNTWALPYEYDPDAKCPRVMAWLRDAMGGDEAMVEYCLAALAAILTGRADLQIFFYLHGPGGTGKSTFIRLAMAMVGRGNSYTTSLKDLENNRFETGCLYGKRLTVINDAGKYGDSVDKLKAATGQDWLRNEKKHVQQSGTASFIYGGMVAIVANVRFSTTDQTSGLERRYRGIDFDVVLTDEQKRAWEAQGGEEAMLHQEMPGLVNRLLEFSREDVGRILNNPPHKSARSNFEAKRTNNHVARWVVDACVPAPSHHAVIGQSRESRTSDGEVMQRDAAEHLYPNFLTFCAREKIYPFNRSRFKDTLADTARSMGVMLVNKPAPGKNVDSFLGIRLRKEHEPRYRWHHTMEDEELGVPPDPFDD